MLASTYIFKPDNHQIAATVIENFAVNWLGWDECGAYLMIKPIESAAGYFRVDIYIDGLVQEYSECCWTDVEVSAKDLTDHMFVVLYEAGFFPEDDLGDPVFSFEDRELIDVITALAANGSRIITPDQCIVWITEKDDRGKLSETRTTSLIDYMLNTA